jgi:hypothetical protein
MVVVGGQCREELLVLCKMAQPTLVVEAAVETTQGLVLVCNRVVMAAQES